MACCAREKDYEYAADNDFDSKGVVNGLPSRDHTQGLDHKESKPQTSNHDWHAEQLAAQEEARRLAGQHAEASSPRSSYARDHVGPPKAQQTNFNQFVAGNHQNTMSELRQPGSVQNMRTQRRKSWAEPTPVLANGVPTQIHHKMAPEPVFVPAPAPVQVVKRSTLEFASPRGRGVYQPSSAAAPTQYASYGAQYDSTMQQHQTRQSYSDFHPSQGLYEERGSAHFIDGASPRHSHRSTSHTVVTDVTEAVSPRHSVRGQPSAAHSVANMPRHQNTATRMWTEEYRQEAPVVVQQAAAPVRILPLGPRNETDGRLSPRSQGRK